MERLRALATIAKQKKLHDLAMLAARKAERAQIEARIAGLQHARTQEARLLAQSDTGADGLFDRYDANLRRRIRRLSKELRDLKEKETAARSSALRAFGRAQAVAILTSREITRRQSLQAKKDELTATNRRRQTRDDRH